MSTGEGDVEKGEKQMLGLGPFLGWQIVLLDRYCCNVGLLGGLN